MERMESPLLTCHLEAMGYRDNTFKVGPLGTSGTEKDNKIDPATGKYCFEYNAQTLNDKGFMVVQVGYVSTVKPKIHLYAFEDHNKDGTQNNKDQFAFGGRAAGVTFENLDYGDYCFHTDYRNSNYKVGPLGTTGTVNDNKIDPTSNTYCFTFNDKSHNDKVEMIVQVGFVRTTKPSVWLYAFEDHNKDGIQNNKDQNAFGGRGNLTKADGTVVQTFSSTNGNKGVHFTDLDDGEYCLNVDYKNDNYKVGPLGTSGAKINNIDPATNKHCFTINEESPTNDKGELLFHVGFVKIVKPRLNPTRMERTIPSFDSTNGANGVDFGTLDDGDYCLNVDYKNNLYKIGPLGTTGTNKDNKIDPTTNKYCFTINEGTNVNSKGEVIVRVGIEPIVPIKLKLFSFWDKNRNGVMDTGDEYISKALGNLTTDGAVVKSFTDSGGNSGVTYSGLDENGEYCLTMGYYNATLDIGPLGTTGTDKDNKIDLLERSKCERQERADHLCWLRKS
ncbi:hypothetical protein SAMD00019534_113330 [Acytostelium subglobosum LB1]|uniref:hypothetical protein n=1 Tax=Acytostelium subglobosum LB1 TaxID=1410327 RepID=UPI000644CD35|nr:hypothetical protein SAMD00019534_113330 [Acytostelium subglobosum LB1]GAM28157.1 hypothetical protein SAMD00019534_113330 [Acytostelium subglobosum LB1]|eukprot:XP_012748791.1 hypothetical protein SAMD00019534_113330 [Acytostelium subglobosum LB1]